ncbi:MAG: transporter substrate-binding domain-containing protein, partial [Firmicutes bacterium]|nr:transporter substrate-binding domain-containing protein [Bacillota bacterium]
MKRGIAVFFIVLLTVTLLVGCSSNEEEPLVVGMELAYPPFETKNNEGEPDGVSVALANALGEYLQKPVRIENTNWDGLIPSLQTGGVDVVLSSMTITAERAESVDFSDPYAHAYLALLVNKESAVDEVEDLNQAEMVIAVKKGTTGHLYAQNNLSNATINALSSENACVMEVVQGKADAFIYDQLTIYRQSQSNPDVTK